MSMVCKQCGAEQAGSDPFCGACGAYLEWEGAPVPPPQRMTPGPVTTQPMPAAQAGPGAGQPQPQPVQSPPQAAPAPPPGYPYSEGRVPPPVPPGYPPAVMPGPQLPQLPQLPQGPLVAARKPADAVKRRPAEPPRETLPAEVYCSRCGTGNLAAQTFCRGCGAALAPTKQPKRPPWWRRLFTRGPRTLRAGQRIRRRRLRFRVGYLFLAALLGGGVALAGPFRGQLDDAVDWVQGLLANTDQVDATATASSERKGHGAAFAVDGARNTYWAPAVSGDGRGQYLAFTFAEPVELAAVVISPGASDSQPEFKKQARPRLVKLSWATKAEGPRAIQRELSNSAEEQTIDIGVAGITRLRLTVLSSYGVEPGRLVAVGEVEFFKTKKQ